MLVAMLIVSRYYGGWAAPNIYFLGFAGVIKFGSIRIGGLSGIYNFRHYKLGWLVCIYYSLRGFGIFLLQTWVRYCYDKYVLLDISVILSSFSNRKEGIICHVCVLYTSRSF